MCATRRPRGFDAVWQAESRLVREATVPMAAFAAATERIKVGSGVVDMLDPQPGAAGLARSRRSTTSRPGGSSSASVRGGIPLARKVGIDRADALTAMREIVEAVRALLANETVTLRRRLRAPRRRRARLRAPGAPAEGRADLHRGHRHADDGAHRRDRRRRRPQLPRLARLQRDGAWSTWPIGAAKAGRTVDDIDRPQLVVCSLDDDRGRRSTPPACSSRSTWASSPTS